MSWLDGDLIDTPVTASDVHAPLIELEERFAQREAEVQAFMPEPGRFGRLRRELARLEERWPDADRRPPLFGVPVGVKDIFHVDGFATRGGSKLPPEELAGPQASCVTQLLEAGALVMGKAVSTEFAYFAPGLTRNPWNLEHTPGGSSSGSAAAVGAGLCPLALGTQTIGSVIRPAAYCGVFGFKPTYGRIDKEGVIPLAPSYDHVGLFVRDLDLLRAAAAVLCSDWMGDSVPVVPGRRPRLGVPEGPYLGQAWPEGLSHFHATCSRLALAGYEVVTVPALADFDEVAARHRRVVAAECARVHAAWFLRYGDLYEQRTAELIRRGQGISDAELERDLRYRATLRDELTALMDDHGIDLWIAPPAQGAAPQGLGATGDPVMSIPWTQAGLPTLAVPAGTNEASLPMGIQLIARWQADEQLLAWADGIAETAKAAAA